MDDIWAVMVPLQNDGGGEWITPEIQVWFSEESEARTWARKWCITHVGRAVVYRCSEVTSFKRVEEAKIKEF